MSRRPVHPPVVFGRYLVVAASCGVFSVVFALWLLTTVGHGIAFWLIAFAVQLVVTLVVGLLTRSWWQPESPRREWTEDDL